MIHAIEILYDKQNVTSPWQSATVTPRNIGRIQPDGTNLMVSYKFLFT